VRDDTSPDTVLATWTAVFPLSHGLAQRVRRHVGWDADAQFLAAIAADYVQELSEQVPNPGRINADGDLIGPADFDGVPHDVLFTAVFNTDLDMIVHRHRPPE
jgi:hypothetical protein